MKELKAFCARYKHALFALVYLLIYLAWFFYIEHRNTSHYKIIHMGIDDYIPFCEVFIIPYFLWFVYMSGVIVYFIFTSKTDYWKACVFYFTGMTVFLIVSTFWPNGHLLRPATLPRDNVFTALVQFLWTIDTPTNLWPSIHVYNSLGAHFAIINSEQFKHRKGIKFASFLLCASIILATVFLKQHSMFDVLTAFVMAAIMYAIVYRYDIVFLLRKAFNKPKTEPLAN